MNKLISAVSPHFHTPRDTQKIMLDVIIALVPAEIASAILFGWRALLVVAVCAGTCVLSEFLFEKLCKRDVTIYDLSAVVTGMILAFNLPVTIPLWQAALGSVTAIIVVKQLFGGIGKNIVNPAMAARVFVMLSWAGQMTKFTAAGARYPFFGNVAGGYDAVASATPLAALKSGNVPDASLFDMFTGKIGGCIGEVSTLLLLLGGIYLFVRRVITWHIPVAFIGTVAVLTYAFPKTGDALTFMLYELTAGGLMLGAFFMATDYVTSPVTKKGQLIFGVGCGLLTVFIRKFGAFPEGVCYSILLMNCTVWIIDRHIRPVRFGVDPAAEKEKAKEAAKK
jgi:electron transport complex protein RnfD